MHCLRIVTSRQNPLILISIANEVETRCDQHSVTECHATS